MSEPPKQKPVLSYYSEDKNVSYQLAPTEKSALEGLIKNCRIEVAGESLGANPCLKICYAGYGHPFILLLEEQGVINDSQIKTREPEDPLDFNFANAKIISKIILNSDSFKEVFSELDTSSDYIEFIVTPEPRSLTILTSGHCHERLYPLHWVIRLQVPEPQHSSVQCCCVKHPDLRQLCHQQPTVNTGLFSDLPDPLLHTPDHKQLLGDAQVCQQTSLPGPGRD